MQGGGGRKGERWVWCAGAGRTGSSAPARLLICFLRGWPPGRSDLGMCRISCNACHCETGDRCHRCGDPVPPALRLLCLRRLPFFLQRKKGRKERRQNQGFGILSAAEVPPASVPFSHATAAQCKFLALLSHSLCISIRDALCACAGWSDRGTLRVCRAAA